MVRRLRIAWALGALVLVTLALLPLQLAALALGHSLRQRVPGAWHRAVAALIGLRVVVAGRPATDRPLLLVSNHQSWADMLALSAAVDCSFVAKSEVRGWPVFGWLAQLQRTVFVARAARRGVAGQAGEIARRLAAGDAIVLFAEGTTSDGNVVLPFKSALFSAVEATLAQTGGARPVAVQPVAIGWACQHGIRLGRSERRRVSWTGGETLVPHLLAFLGAGGFDARIVFGAPLLVAGGTDRKVLAERCRTAVRAQLGEALRGPFPAPGEKDRRENACVEGSGSRY